MEGSPRPDEDDEQELLSVSMGSVRSNSPVNAISPSLAAAAAAAASSTNMPPTPPPAASSPVSRMIAWELGMRSGRVWLKHATKLAARHAMLLTLALQSSAVLVLSVSDPTAFDARLNNGHGRVHGSTLAFCVFIQILQCTVLALGLRRIAKHHLEMYVSIKRLFALYVTCAITFASMYWVTFLFDPVHSFKIDSADPETLYSSAIAVFMTMICKLNVLANFSRCFTKTYMSRLFSCDCFFRRIW
jgi:hypothetical protein